MYFNIAVALDKKDKKVNDIAREANDLLNKFDLNREVPEYKRYLDSEEIQSIAKHYEISPDDFKSVSLKVKDYHEQGEGGVDEKGVYELTTNNPNGHFDHFEVFYYATPDDFAEKIVGEGGNWPRVRSFVTPDLEWIEGYWSDIDVDPKFSTQILYIID